MTRKTAGKKFKGNPMAERVRSVLKMADVSKKGNALGLPPMPYLTPVAYKKYKGKYLKN